jgi:hypothetical protein
VVNYIYCTPDRGMYMFTNVQKISSFISCWLSTSGLHLIFNNIRFINFYFYQVYLSLSSYKLLWNHIKGHSSSIINRWTKRLNIVLFIKYKLFWFSRFINSNRLDFLFLIFKKRLKFNHLLQLLQRSFYLYLLFWDLSWCLFR